MENLEIINAGDNGIYMEGSNNTLQSLWVHNNQDAGVQLSNGAAYNTLTNITSYYNILTPVGLQNTGNSVVFLEWLVFIIVFYQIDSRRAEKNSPNSTKSHI